MTVNIFEMRKRIELLEWMEAERVINERWAGWALVISDGLEFTWDEQSQFADRQLTVEMSTGTIRDIPPLTLELLQDICDEIASHLLMPVRIRVTDDEQLAVSADIRTAEFERRDARRDAARLAEIMR